MKRIKKMSIGQILLNIFFILLCVCYVFPLLVLISASFDGSSTPHFNIYPSEFTLNAYRQLFATPRKIFTAYGVTGFYSVAATLGGLLVNSMFAYALSHKDFGFRKVLTFIMFFTTLFNGGLVPSYIINSRYLHLNNTIWIYIIPALVNAWNIIVLRTFFQGIPYALYESARIDGASELRTCFQIYLPLAAPALASVGFLAFIGHWNNWYTCNIYIRKPELYSLQYLLKIIMDSVELLTQMVNEGAALGTDMELKNLESLRFAMAVVASLPMLFVFPFFQKYFAKGLTLGSVKG